MRQSRAGHGVWTVTSETSTIRFELNKSVSSNMTFYQDQTTLWRKLKLILKKRESVSVRLSLKSGKNKSATKKNRGKIVKHSFFVCASFFFFSFENLSPTLHLGHDKAASFEYFRLSIFKDLLGFLFIVLISSLRFAASCQPFKSNLLMRGLYMEFALLHGPIVAKVFTIYFITSICSLLKPDNFLQYSVHQISTVSIAFLMGKK